MVTQGNTAPDFTLETDRGAKVMPSQLRGRQVVLFFYPKDGTPGCTIECKEFRDGAPQVEGKAIVLGVSADDRPTLGELVRAIDLVARGKVETEMDRVLPLDRRPRGTGPMARHAGVHQWVV